MPRRTKEQLRVDRNEERLDKLVQSNRFLSNPNYYKNNFWSTAAFDSWAAKGQAGSCGCGCGYYNHSLCNTRRSTKRGGSKEHCRHVVEKICHDCVNGIEKRLQVKFKRRY
jgi:hypothetical protein